MSSPRRFSWVVLRKYVPVFHAEEKEQEDKIMAEASKDWGTSRKGPGYWTSSRSTSTSSSRSSPPCPCAPRSRRGSAASLRPRLRRGELPRHDSGVLGQSVRARLRRRQNSLSLLPAIMYSFSGCDFASVVDPVPFYLLRPLPSATRRRLLRSAHSGVPVRESRQSVGGSAMLIRWSSHAPGNKWTKQEARFSPHTQVPPTRRRTGGRSLYFQRKECQGRDFSRSYPRDRRTMGPVGGSIKLISIVTISGDPHDNTAPADIVLRAGPCRRTSTHGRETKTWSCPCRCSGSQRPTSARGCRSVPEASPQGRRGGVLYLLLGDYYLDWERRARLCREIECVISIDMRTKSLLSCSHRPIKDGLPARALWEDDELSEGFYPDIPSLFAAKFCANHTGWSDGLLHKDKRNRLI
ncbi:hypothetical protein ZWY2020_018556 [Hordeum vulgare]|nr:hypothetical protein ZWY2020_018556 [Hordeum vulgare]